MKGRRGIQEEDDGYQGALHSDRTGKLRHRNHETWSNDNRTTQLTTQAPGTSPLGWLGG
jgi:hypothetical protein